ncbi:MAG: hypothetical protein COV29_04090 [Candidatus Yanofskybacteria bacterium CG10_big_fil_rev_8_21_14_0_10_36_16]|uniref:Nucleotidyl transferase domain-containing protein n=1 Tax=Candidatus Yanofskybacteria bacterium CG10_big_fil_rev_8_21_14_0_10_36_16 TaxID=1975096 RepID=A0A2J0Q6W8_9BACT|nr:MAG: hypothetical protein COV29_04090 [Candidatus Yanofskybacteria bacterium CG10_big_fil_rev_8_21_14_0_10_36_16]
MKAIILAAGKGTRMQPLTEKVPKPLIKVMGKPLIKHILDSLPPAIDELIIVIGYRGDQIREFLGNKHNGINIKYIFQKNTSGTAHALLLCRPFLGKEKFLVLFADDIHGSDGLKNVIKHELALVVSKSKNPEKFGVIITDNENRVIDFEEKPQKPKSNLIFTGIGILDHRIFNYKSSKNITLGEYYLTDMINQLIRDHKVIAEPASLWIPVGYPRDIKRAEKILKNKND